MRTVHRTVTLNVVTVEDDNALGGEAVENMLAEVDLTGECGRGFNGSVNVQSVDVISSTVTDSR